MRGKELLLQLMQEAGLNRKMAAAGCGIPYNTYAKLVDGNRDIKLHHAIPISGFFSTHLNKEINPQDLVTNRDLATNLYKSPIKCVPVYRYDPDGKTTLSEEHRLDDEEILVPDKNEDLFMLDMTESESPIYQRKLVLFKKQDTIESGKAALVLFKNALLFRIVKWNEGNAILYPLTPNGTPQLDIAPPGTLQVMGKALRIEEIL